MSGRQFSRAPVALRRARMDNLVLVPGSQLPYKARWQELANALPHGSTLIVLPSRACLQRRTLQSVANSLRAKGLPVSCQSV
jgi:hypothetical protein